jgi:Tfp pilus assembly protein PilF
MKVFRNSTTALALAAVASLSLLGSGCEYVRKVIAKDKLNQGAIEYNKGNTREAQEFFKDASETDPSNPSTWLFLGATIVKEYRKEIDEAKKKEMAKHALEVYQKALSLSNDNCTVVENALSYLAVIYKDMKNDDEWRKATEARAVHTCTKNDAKAAAFYGIGVEYWQCSYDQTTRYQDKALFSKDQFHYRRMDYSPEALADKQKAEVCVTKGFEYLEKALALDPEYTQAMYYKALLYRERQKMTKEEPKRKEFEQMADKISASAIALDKKREAEAAARKAQEATSPTS